MKKKYNHKLLAKWQKFIRRIEYHGQNGMESIVIYHRHSTSHLLIPYSLRVIKDEIHHRTIDGNELMKYVLGMGLR